VPRNWDQHYSDPAHLDLTPHPLLVQVADLLPPGDALDLACGPGRHALHLAKLGWNVTAVDSSVVAIRLLRERAAGLPIQAVQADLERGEFAITSESYDLICDFFYLQRDLIPHIHTGVRPGGTIAAAIRLTGSWRMEPAELRAAFDGWKILYYSETDTAQIIARKA
jgi:SAM-dependent methyltransferase